MSQENTTAFRWHGLLAAAIGLIVAFATLDPWFLLGNGVKWQNPTGDITMYVVASTYYMHDSWHFPVWAIPPMGYPEGASIVYTDAIPVAALLVKIVGWLTGWYFNYLGPWTLLCYVLLAVLTARLAWRLGNRSLVVSGALAIFVTCCAAFMLRVQHTALCAQFVILWAFLAYLRLREPNPPVARVALPPLLITFLVNPYLFAMVAPIVAAGAVAQIPVRAMRRQLLTTAAMAAVIFGVVIVVGGFIPRGVKLGALSDSGFGHASWNPISLVAPPGGAVTAPLLGKIVRDATGGQHEGESYLGLAPILMLLAWLWLRPGEVWQRIVRHWALVLVLAGFALFALSDHAYLRSVPLWEVNLPHRAERAAALFRMSGRFVWPMMYLLLILPTVYLFRRSPRAVGAGILTCAAVLQFAELMPDRRFLREWTGSPSPDLVNVRVLGPLMKEHTRLWQYPSWYCGGLGSQALVGVNPREYQVQSMAAMAGLPTNSVYMSRPFKDCERERAEVAAMKTFEPGVLYIFSHDGVDGVPGLAARAHSPACRDLGWAWVCSGRLGSQQAAQPAEGAGEQDQRSAPQQADLHR